jgi:protein-tyrosine phosphatase
VSTPHERRLLMLEGASNMRDLGGVPATNGYTVRMGRLFRADALHALTDTDLEVLEPLGIQTVVDLRSRLEIDDFGIARVVDLGVRHLHAPLLGYEPIPANEHEIFPTLGESYRMMARNFAEHIASAINQISMPVDMPLIFHCAAGKDRTGVTAALIYSILGVDRETIAADYALTNEAMQRILASLTPDELAEARKLPPSYIHAEASSITFFLEALDIEFGSPQDWMLSAGVEEESFDRLREAMLT